MESEPKSELEIAYELRRERVRAQARGQAEETVRVVLLAWEAAWYDQSMIKPHASEAVAEAGAEAEALGLAGAWAWARGQVRTRGDKVPPVLTSSLTIFRILSDLHRYGVASDLLQKSPETRDDYSSLILFFAPITRLPSEL